VLPPGFADGLAERYRIQRELGRGGMATVYLAEDVKHHRPVAIKVLSPELASVLGHDRFLREIEVAAQLTHPHILPLHDSGTSAGLLYYVMPYIEGETLRDRVSREKQLPVDEAVDITRKVAAALAHAHSRGVIHRDIKPENILLADGEPIVADFGIAKAVTAAGGQHLTETGMALGTAAYMSPEQALGESDLDARSDIYSLGTVLYEMLAGQPPYSGATAQAIMARRMTDPVPPLRTVRELVPSTLQQVVEKALARLPADRYSSGQAFAAALTAPASGAAIPTPVTDIQQGVTPARPAPARRAVYAGVILLIALLGLVFWFRRPSSSTPLDANLIAVAPFDVRGAELASWGEGMVDYLSRSLDGAGQLRTVSPSTFIRHWEGRADPASAEALGRRTGSGLVVYGSMVRAAGDSLRLRATLFDVRNREAVGEVEVTGDTLSIDRLADSLAVALLTTLGRTRPVGAVRNGPLGAVSLPAIKEFLQGEQMYRRSNWDSALVHYGRAISLDTSFALAYRRIAATLGWGPRQSSAYEPLEAYIVRAQLHNRGLAPRDSMLIAAEYLSYRLPGDPGFFEPYRALMSSVEEAARRFPGDPEVWQALGEAKYHINFGQSFPPGEKLEPFDQAIALDPEFAPAFEHVFELAFSVGGVERARRYAAAWSALEKDDSLSSSNRLAVQLLDSSLTPEARDRLIKASNTYDLFRGGLEHLYYLADSAETAVQLIRALHRGNREHVGEPWVVDSLMWSKYLARLLLLRGHIHEAGAVYRTLIGDPTRIVRFGGFMDPVVDLGLLGELPADTVGLILAQLSPSGLHPRALPWWLFRRDTSSLRGFILGTREQARDAATPVERLRASDFAAVGEAFLALARGDSTSALQMLEARPDSICLVTGCFFSKLIEARLLVARREDRKAASLLERYRWGNSVFFVVATMEGGQIAERLGERNRAVENYQQVVDFWRRADPELQTYVRQAQDGLGRLTGEP
jgi:tetratricopeptide (TPR) repeat protein